MTPIPNKSVNDYSITPVSLPLGRGQEVGSSSSRSKSQAVRSQRGETREGGARGVAMVVVVALYVQLAVKYYYSFIIIHALAGQKTFHIQSYPYLRKGRPKYFRQRLWQDRGRDEIAVLLTALQLQQTEWKERRIRAVVVVPIKVVKETATLLKVKEPSPPLLLY